MFSQLIANSSSAQSLSAFICNNSSLIDEFVDSGIESQRQKANAFDEFVLLGSRVQILDSLDFSLSQNRAFIAILFDYAERVNASAAILQLYQIIQRHKIDIGSRLRASMLYLYDVPNNQVYIDRFDDICTKLQTAIDEEDDNDNKAIATFLNYYSSVVYNTAPHLQFAKELQAKAINSTKIYPFLQKEQIASSISLNVDKTENVYFTIQATIDGLLRKREKHSISLQTDFIIESNTKYSLLLSKTPQRFDRIRQISVSQLALLENRDEVFHSLGRGVAILNQEAQLYSYMNSYGLMHKAKLDCAFSHFQFNDIIDYKIELYDWSCGQGLASIVLLEYLREHNIQLSLNKITLIEPSEITLKRASLHIRHYDYEINIKTILKDIDSLINTDIDYNNRNVKFHLFSNILDVETFSIQHLIELIKNYSRGINYFVCVSPYINDVKTARIESFMNSFSHNSTFNVIYQDMAIRGGWINSWTKLIKVFSVVLP